MSSNSVPVLENAIRMLYNTFRSLFMVEKAAIETVAETTEESHVK